MAPKVPTPFELVIFKLISRIVIPNISYQIALKLMPQNLTDD